MSINGNLPGETLNTQSSSAYFNNFYSQQRFTSPMINDAVVAYFQSVTGDVETGTNLAGAVIYTAVQQGMDPMGIIQQLKQLSEKNKLNSPEYSTRIEPGTKDTSVYDPQTGTWSSPATQNAVPGPSTTYIGISELDAYLTVFLNLNRVGTSLLGLSNSPQTNRYVKRTILA
jgi:hypothetical protein